jgi:hypothetical protein
MVDVADPGTKHLLGFCVPGLELAKSCAQALVGPRDLSPLLGFGHRVTRVVVARTGVKERLHGWEVAVDGGAVDTSPPGDRLHAGARGTDGLMQGRCRLGDPLAGLEFR